jgi:hypothetical protein
MMSQGTVLASYPLPSASLHMHHFFVCPRPAGIFSVSLRTPHSNFTKAWANCRLCGGMPR